MGRVMVYLHIDAYGFPYLMNPLLVIGRNAVSVFQGEGYVDILHQLGNEGRLANLARAGKYLDESARLINSRLERVILFANIFCQKKEDFLFKS